MQSESKLSASVRATAHLCLKMTFLLSRTSDVTFICMPFGTRPVFSIAEWMFSRFLWGWSLFLVCCRKTSFSSFLAFSDFLKSPLPVLLMHLFRNVAISSLLIAGSGGLKPTLYEVLLFSYYFIFSPGSPGRLTHQFLARSRIVSVPGWFYSMSSSFFCYL